MLLPEVSNWLILFVGIGGAILNIACVFVFAKQKFRKKLHKLLMILALYDLLVSESLVLKNINAIARLRHFLFATLQIVTLCVLQFPMPHLVPSFAGDLRRLSPILGPITHIALMSSVYSTVVMTWERSNDSPLN